MTSNFLQASTARGTHVRMWPRPRQRPFSTPFRPSTNPRRLVHAWLEYSHAAAAFRHTADVAVELRKSGAKASLQPHRDLIIMKENNKQVFVRLFSILLFPPPSLGRSETAIADDRTAIADDRKGSCPDKPPIHTKNNKNAPVSILGTSETGAPWSCLVCGTLGH